MAIPQTRPFVRHSFEMGKASISINSNQQLEKVTVSLVPADSGRLCLSGCLFIVEHLHE